MRPLVIIDGENRPTRQGPFWSRDVSGVLRQGIWFWRRESSDNGLVGQGGITSRPAFIDEENFSDILAKPIMIWDTDVSIYYLSILRPCTDISPVFSRPRL